MNKLRRPHASIPRSPRIDEPLFLARYIEKAGTDTMEMTLADKLTSSQQKYRLTEQGAAWLDNRATNGPKGP